MPTPELTNALEKGHTMNKIVALGCAATALAIASTAGAQTLPSTGDQFQVQIKGWVPGYCTIAAPLTVTGWG